MRAADAGRIAELLGDLPIAVAAAGAWLADTGNSVDEYLRQIARLGPRILREPMSNLSVEATWNLSLERLEQRSPAANRLLQMCSVFAPEIALDLVYSDAFAAALTPYDPSATDNMIRASLVQQVHRLALLRVDPRGEPTGGNERGSTGTVFVHRLLQHAVRSRMTEQELEETRHQVHQVLAAARPRNPLGDEVDPNNSSMSCVWSAFAAAVCSRMLSSVIPANQSRPSASLGASPTNTDVRVTRPPSSAAQARACGPPPDRPTTANRSIARLSAIVATSNAGIGDHPTSS